MFGAVLLLLCGYVVVCSFFFLLTHNRRFCVHWEQVGKNGTMCVRMYAIWLTQESMKKKVNSPKGPVREALCGVCVNECYLAGDSRGGRWRRLQKIKIYRESLPSPFFIYTGDGTHIFELFQCVPWKFLTNEGIFKGILLVSRWSSHRERSSNKNKIPIDMYFLTF